MIINSADPEEIIKNDISYPEHFNYSKKYLQTHPNIVSGQYIYHDLINQCQTIVDHINQILFINWSKWNKYWYY